MPLVEGGLNRTGQGIPWGWEAGRERGWIRGWIHLGLLVTRKGSILSRSYLCWVGGRARGASLKTQLGTFKASDLLPVCNSSQQATLILYHSVVTLVHISLDRELDFTLFFRSRRWFPNS